MGYTTYFEGEIKVDPPLSPMEINFLKKFSETRRMKRAKGPYYVNGSGMAGQGRDDDIIDFNLPPEGQPGLWCNWEPTDDGTAIRWNEVEKFYDSAQWMAYIIDHFVGSDPAAKNELRFLNGHTLNGEIMASGEDPDDRWRLIVQDNSVFTQYATIEFTGPLKRVPQTGAAQ